MELKTRDNESIEYVISRKTHKRIKSSDYFKNEEDPARRLEITEDRNITQLNPQESEYICGICKEPVQIYGKINHVKGLQKRHFRHARNIESDCPYKSSENFTKEQINLMNYFGKRESYNHKRLKQEIRQILEFTTGVSNIEEEKWEINNSIVKHLTKRKPDIKFLLNENKFAFEIQVSQLFLSVINDRQLFYKNNNINLLWIADDFDEETKKRRLYLDDIFISQNRNFFVFDFEAKERSYEKKELFLKCIYNVPILDIKKLNELENTSLNKYPIIDEQKIEYISIRELSIADNEVYYFDYENERKKIIENELQRAEQGVFEFDRYSQKSSIINKDWNFEKNISRIIEKLRDGTKFIYDFEGTKEFGEIQRIFRGTRERLAGIEAEIEAEKLEYQQRTERLKHTETELRSITEELSREKRVHQEFAEIESEIESRKRDLIDLQTSIHSEISEQGKSIARERIRIAERIRKKKRNLEEQAKKEAEFDEDSRRNSIRNDIAKSKESESQVREDIFDIIDKIRDLREKTERIQPGNTNSKNEIRRSVSVEHKKNREELRQAFNEATKSNPPFSKKHGIFREGLEAWEFLINLEEKEQLLSRLKGYINQNKR